LFSFATDFHGVIRTAETREFAHFSENVQPFGIITDLLVNFLSLFRLKKGSEKFQSVQLKKVRRFRTLRPKASDSLSEGFGRKFRNEKRKFPVWEFFCGACFFLQEGSPLMPKILK
jgi:hypothetical protein